MAFIAVLRCLLRDVNDSMKSGIAQERGSRMLRHSSMKEAGRDAPEIGMVQAWVGQKLLNATF